MAESNGRLAGKVAVVVGSTSGIGAAIARRFAAEGASVVLSGRRSEQGEAVVREIVEKGGRAVFQRTDVKQPEDCAALVKRAKEAYGGLDSLVYNTGIFNRATFDEITPEFWDGMQAVNVRGAFLVSQAAAPLMRQRGGGSITMMGSIHAFVSSEKLIPYGVSKGALLALTRELSGYLKRDRIRVNWITVGWVLTDKEKETQMAEHGDLKRVMEFGARAPWGLNTEEEMASGCVYLASDEAMRVTGTNLNISGGIHLSL
ncbi:MAG: SDR family oxidoreductase [Opitutaceae bacterium]